LIRQRFGESNTGVWRSTLLAFSIFFGLQQNNRTYQGPRGATLGLIRSSLRLLTIRLVDNRHVIRVARQRANVHTRNH
jgi:hypothetical protein